MKPALLFFVASCLFSAASQAQVLFSEDFDGIAGTTSGGAGTYAFPAGWLLRNVDNLVPNASVAYVNEAWERREDFKTNVADSAAFSTSWYTPAGTANDWMWTPPITLTGTDISLKWKAVAYDIGFPDGYEVRIMAAPNVPTGGPGDIGNQLSAAVLFSTAAEDTAWTNHQVSLNSYLGQTVRIGFRNNSVDKFILLIDDVVVENTPPSNVGIGTTSPQRKLHVNDVMRLEPRNTAPENPGRGDIYYDGVLNKLRVYDGTTWQNCW